MYIGIELCVNTTNSCNYLLHKRLWHQIENIFKVLGFWWEEIYSCNHSWLYKIISWKINFIAHKIIWNNFYLKILYIFICNKKTDRIFLNKLFIVRYSVYFIDYRRFKVFRSSHGKMAWEFIFLEFIL